MANPFADDVSADKNEQDPFGSPQTYGQGQQTQPTQQTQPPPAPVQATQPQQQQQTQPPPAPVQSQPQYDQSNNYEVKNDNNNTNIDINKYISPEQQNQIAYQAGTAVANNAKNAGQDEVNKAVQDYKAKTAQQKDVNEAPEPPACVIKCIQWFPLRFFAMIGGLLLIALSIVDIFIAKPTFTEFFIYAYLFIFGIMAFFVEAPTFNLSRKVQLSLSFWFRLLSRTWGRAWFYLFIAFLCFGNYTSSSVSTTGETPPFKSILLAGIYVVLISVLSFIFGRLSAKKYQRMYIYMAAGTEGDQLIGNLIRKFDELDTDQDGRLGAEDISRLAEQASRSLSNSERHAIQSFLDESCNGYVSKEDWMKQWTTYNLEQRML